MKLRLLLGLVLVLTVNAARASEAIAAFEKGVPTIFIAGRLGLVDSRFANLGTHGPFRAVNVLVGTRDGEVRRFVVTHLGDQQAFVGLASGEQVSVPLSLGGLPVRNTSLHLTFAKEQLAYRWEDAPEISAVAFVRDLERLPAQTPEGSQTGVLVGPAPITVVNWWSSWCAPCREEIPALGQLVHDYASDARVRFVAVSPENPAVVRAAVGETGLLYEPLVALAGESVFGGSYPRHLVIAHGQLLFDFAGYGPDTTARLRAAIDEALATTAKQP